MQTAIFVLRLATATAFASTPSLPAWQQLVELYELQPHIEGGFFKETYKAQEDVLRYIAPSVNRSASTAIYYLLPYGEVSTLHRLVADEVWHFYLGGPLTVVELDEEHPMHARETVLGHNVLEGQLVQYVVKAGTWFGAYPTGDQSSYSFVGNTVAPGFEFADFEAGSRQELLQQFPKAQEVIEKLT